MLFPLRLRLYNIYHKTFQVMSGVSLKRRMLFFADRMDRKISDNCWVQVEVIF